MPDVTALYIRLSVDDENPGESNSVTNQRDLLNMFVRSDPSLSGSTVLEFVDDGWSGTNFERPSIKRLLELARTGGVNCIAVKDLSRFGRNYVEVYHYIERIFPFLGIRFICVNDRYDSRDYIGKTAPLDMAFGALVHDLYSKELSLKIHQVNEARAARGEFFAGNAPYGFVRSKTRKNMFEIDEEAADVVRRIFALAAEGMKAADIAVILNNGKVDTPAEYHARNGRKLRGRRRQGGGKILWIGNTVREILRDERYTGVQILCKTKRAAVGSSKSITLPESEWLRFPDAHEAIIPADDFQKIKGMYFPEKQSGGTPRKARETPLSPYAGKIRCGCCGYALAFMKSSRPYYKCRARQFADDVSCFSDKLYLDELDGAVLSAVKAEVRKRYERIRALSEKKAPHPVEMETDSLAKLELRRSTLLRRLDSLYDDYADGRLDKAGYVDAKAACKAELDDSESRIAVLSAAVAVVPAEAIAAVKTEAPVLERILSATAVTGEIAALIERITVYSGGRFEIGFAFRDTNRLDG